jgi:hypothetical protein
VAEEETTSTEQEQEQQEENQQGNESQWNETGTNSENNERTFTQQELNDIVQGRLSKKDKAIADELGMTVEEAKKQLQAIKDKEEAEKSEIEKVKEELESVKTEAKTERERAARIKRESQIKDAANELDFQDPSDAITFLDESKFEYDDDGNITNAKTLLTELAEAKKYLIKPAPSWQNPANPGNGKKPIDENTRLRKYGYQIPNR